MPASAKEDTASEPPSPVRRNAAQKGDSHCSPVIIQNLNQAMSAARAAVERKETALWLASTPAAGISLGSGWFVALEDTLQEAFPDLHIKITVDYGDAAGRVLEGLRLGVRSIIFTGPVATRHKLQEIARASNAEIIDQTVSF